MFCKHCQDYIPEDSRFCPKCGVRLRSEPAQDPTMVMDLYDSSILR